MSDPDLIENRIKDFQKRNGTALDEAPSADLFLQACDLLAESEHVIQDIRARAKHFMAPDIYEKVMANVGRRSEPCKELDKLAAAAPEKSPEQKLERPRKKRESGLSM